MVKKNNGEVFVLVFIALVLPHLTYRNTRSPVNSKHCVSSACKQNVFTRNVIVSKSTERKKQDNTL